MISKFRALSDKKQLELNAAREVLRNEKEALSDAKESLKHLLEAQRVVSVVAAGVQQKVHNHIAGIVTRCLQTVFDNPYEFRIYFDQKRNKTEARMVFSRDGYEIDPTTASGGGVVDVAAFALRLAALLLTKGTRKLLVLDEPFRFVSRSRNYGQRMKQLLETLAEELQVQIILVTHDEHLVCGKVIDLS